MNPDYPNVTILARTFFEEQQDWSSAIELALDESFRLESTEWFDVLIRYVKNGHTVIKEFGYFAKGLNLLLVTLDSQRFEELAQALWNSYLGTAKHMDWVIVINQVISMMRPEEVQAWGKLSRLYEESYFGLINGNYLVKDIEGIIPQLLKNWLKVCDSVESWSSADVLCWEEIFPRSIEAGTIYKAENLLLDLEHTSTSIEDVIVLAKDILAWARSKIYKLQKH